MKNDLLHYIKTSMILMIVLTVLMGGIYPAIITGIAQYIFPWRANGSLIRDHDEIIGSALIGQSFSDPRYFWGRPSATTSFPYNAEYSGGSNMGPSNPHFLATIQSRALFMQKFPHAKDALIPVDLVTASGSGLDPDISPAAARYQILRIAKARGLEEKNIRMLIDRMITPPELGLLGEPRINVLALNLALDKMTTPRIKQ